MPFVHIRIAGKPLSPGEIQNLQTEATNLMAAVLRKKPELTAVLVEAVETRGWSIGGVPVPLAAHLDAKVTSGTNTADEKAAFIERAHGLLSGLLGADLPLATYVVVHEIEADAWGYDGRTQASRRIA